MSAELAEKPAPPERRTAVRFEGEPDWTDYPGSYPPAFVRFHEKNLWVYDALVRQAKAIKKRGFPDVGLHWLYEGIRYGDEIGKHQEAKAGFEFGLDNDHAAIYGRMIEVREPDLEGFFNMRPLRRIFATRRETTLTLDFGDTQ